MEGSRTVRRAIQVLELLRESTTPLTISEIARALGMSRSSAHQIVVELDRAGCVAREGATKRYVLGLSLFDLGAYVGRHTEVVWRLTPYLRHLSLTYAVTSVVAVPWRSRLLVISAIAAPISDRVDVVIGARVPITAGCLGKAYFAGQHDSSEYEGHLERFTPNSIAEPAGYRVAIEEARQRGYATDREEFVEGVGGVAAPLVAPDGRVSAVAALVGRAVRGTHEQPWSALGAELRDVIRQLSNSASVRDHTYMFAASPALKP